MTVALSRAFAVVVGLLCVPLAHARSALAGEDAYGIGRHTCDAIVARVDAIAGDGPVLLRSYDNADDDGAVAEPALATAAFSYDNALAVIALVACDRRAAALRVGEGLRRAVEGDSRLRNTYRAGPVDARVLANGWWDAPSQRWVEDRYQQGSATGNVAWVALAMLALHDATGATRWHDAAVKLAEWVVVNTSDPRGAGGFSGGIDGFDAEPHRLGWKSTEHAIDLVALFARLEADDPGGRWHSQQAIARRFLDSQWDAAGAHFLVGTLADGVGENRTTSALDVQLWSQLLADRAPAWASAVAYAERVHAVGDGFDFNADRDGQWMEGTAQAALVYRLRGDGAHAERCLAAIAAEVSGNGYVYATREPRITTGLSIGPASASADFYYYRRPHLGATAWATLAAYAWNPLVAH